MEIMKKTRFSTPMGDLLICRVADSGYVQIAGPPAAMDTKRVCEEMFGYGCELILIDGAIDRKSIASPETSDAIILSTGAVLSRSMKKVVDETAHVVNLYSIPELEEGQARTIIEENNKIKKLKNSKHIKKERTTNEKDSCTYSCYPYGSITRCLW